MLFHKQGLALLQAAPEGRNWDIITDTLVLIVLMFFKDGPLLYTTYLVSNLIGMGLVLNVEASTLSLPIQIFAEDNTWITQLRTSGSLPSLCNFPSPSLTSSRRKALARQQTTVFDCQFHTEVQHEKLDKSFLLFECADK